MHIVRSQQPAHRLPDETSSEATVRGGWKLLEALVLTGMFPALGYAFSPSDPFLLDASFPWLALAPLLVGLQHGLVLGVVSATLLCLGAWAHAEVGVWFGLQPLQAHGFLALAPWGTACLLGAAISGHFRDHWQAQITALSDSNAEHGKRLRRLDLAHTVLKLSHARLEERVAAERWSLESCVQDAARQFHALGSFAELGKVALDLLANHAMVQSASLFVPRTKPPTGQPSHVLRRLVSQKAAPLNPIPLVVLGAELGSRSTHPLVEAAWFTGRLQAVTGAPEDDPHDGSVLAAVPLLAPSGRLLGVVAVHEMPFMAFQSENLKCLALLAARLADLIEQHLPGADPSASLPLLEPVLELSRKKSGLFRIQTPSPPAVVAWQSQSRKTRS